MKYYRYSATRIALAEALAQKGAPIPSMRFWKYCDNLETFMWLLARFNRQQPNAWQYTMTAEDIENNSDAKTIGRYRYASQSIDSVDPLFRHVYSSFNDAGSVVLNEPEKE